LYEEAQPVAHHIPDVGKMVAHPVAWVDMCDGVPTGSPRFWQEHNHDEVPLYAAPVMQTNVQDLDTSQERVNKLEKINQMLVEALKEARDSLESSRIFVTTKERTKHPEGVDWYDEKVSIVCAALAAVEKP
jgi:TPP-dependent trihydroxycyclohexane-1,2-dione (THcHDO) dehydratase